MILKIIPAKSAFNCANYILKDDAVLVATNMESVGAPGLAREFGLVTSLNPLKHKVVHLVISHPLGERVSMEQGAHEVREALKGLGYENCPFHAVEHHDATKQHFHIATTPTDYDGKRIDRGGDRFKAKAICRRLEKEAGLVAVTNYKDRTQAPPEISTPEIQVADLNAALYAAILPAVKRSKTVGELAQDLLRHGIQMEASFGAKGAAGLGFRLLGDQGGFLTASEVHPSLTIVKLQKKHGLSYEMGRDDAHLVPMHRKPQQPIQPVLAAMAEPSPASPRIKASADQITRHILDSYKQRSTYVQGHFRVVAPPAAKRGTAQPICRPATPAIRAAHLSTRLRAAAPTPARDTRGPVRGLVQPESPFPAPAVQTMPRRWELAFPSQLKDWRERSLKLRGMPGIRHGMIAGQTWLLHVPIPEGEALHLDTKEGSILQGARQRLLLVCLPPMVVLQEGNRVAVSDPRDLERPANASKMPQEVVTVPAGPRLLLAHELDSLAWAASEDREALVGELLGD